MSQAQGRTVAHKALILASERHGVLTYLRTTREDFKYRP